MSGCSSSSLCSVRSITSGGRSDLSRARAASVSSSTFSTWDRLPARVRTVCLICWRRTQSVSGANENERSVGRYLFEQVVLLLLLVHLPLPDVLVELLLGERHAGHGLQHRVPERQGRRLGATQRPHARLVQPRLGHLSREMINLAFRFPSTQRNRATRVRVRTL